MDKTIEIKERKRSRIDPNDPRVQDLFNDYINKNASTDSLKVIKEINTNPKLKRKNDAENNSKEEYNSYDDNNYTNNENEINNQKNKTNGYQNK